MFMEYFWYFIAALGAGVGTGLAGLSAATAMVPILIVLCPSFAGETGAYHATAIALASDVLGSAFTSAIYIKHRNIDLKRGCIMAVCIIGMCIAGSFAAWSAGNVVLGGASLILCVGIGIRFLIKPDTERKETVARGAGLDAKGIVISLFFGLTIGFGTGFLGSGGGMMMLVVFTAFLGMERKSAVGTSTFIMTFTALIASVSHMIIDPTILTQRTGCLVVCIITATIASIVSAQFANKFSNRIVGLVTGAVLTVLGVTMLCMNYREALGGLFDAMPLLGESVRCFGKYLVYLAVCVAILLLFRLTRTIPQHIFRKMLHFVAMTSVPFMIQVSDSWQPVFVCALFFAIVVYPVLALAERWKGYHQFFAEKTTGEIKRSLVDVFGTHAFLTLVLYGWLDMPYLVSAAILTWGIGDTAAALVGIRFGKHHIPFRYADQKKTWEGTLANAVISFIMCLTVLLLLSPYSPAKCILLSLFTAPVSAAVELYTKNGNDTITCPVANSIVLAMLSLL